MRRMDDEDAKRAKRAKLLRALMALDDDTEAMRADDDDLDDEEADEDDLGGAPRGMRRAKKARRADDDDLEDDDSTMRRARRSSDDAEDARRYRDSSDWRPYDEDKAWGMPDMAPYAKNSRFQPLRVGPGRVPDPGRDVNVGDFPRIIKGHEVTGAKLAVLAQQIAKREGLNFRDINDRLMAYALAERAIDYKGAERW